MKIRRVIIVYVLFAAAACALMLRLQGIMTDGWYAAAAASQRSFTVTAGTLRPDFYDCNGVKLTSAQSEHSAVVIPGTVGAVNITAYVYEGEREYFENCCAGNSPFLVRVTQELPEHFGVTGIALPVRYSGTAAHILGYLNGDGVGVSGLERVFESMFAAATRTARVNFTVDAYGQVMTGTAVNVSGTEASPLSVQLTLDAQVQAAAEAVADELLYKGAIVVLDSSNGEIRALVSRPDFDQYDVAAAIAADDSALVNRTLTSYSVGSVYKPVIQAAALDAGIDDFTYTCTGSIEVDGTVFHCSNGTAHGELDMAGAMACSCNCFHIALAQHVGAAAIRAKAAQLGFGDGIDLYNGLGSAGGYLPSESELNNISELCNHAFGQGLLLADPLQIAAMINCFANGGEYTVPTLVRHVGTVYGLSDEPAQAQSYRVVSESAAQSIAQSLALVVSDGTGRAAAPQYVDACGKTGTAETGRYTADGTQYQISWFAGWLPADEPEYVIVTMSEIGGDGDVRAANVFAAVADRLYASEPLP